MKKQITVSGILEDLENGLTRFSNSTGYDPEIGCIADKYDLTAKEVRRLFQHEKLKGKKTHKVEKITFELIDDLEEESVDLLSNEEVENVVETTEEAQQPNSDSFTHITSL